MRVYPWTSRATLKHALDELEHAEREALQACVKKAELTASQIVLTDIRSRTKEMFVLERQMSALETR